jgi:hypothetical protein
MHRTVGNLPVKLGWFLVVQLSWILSMGLFRAADLTQGTAIIHNALQGIWLIRDTGFDTGGTSGLIGLGWWFTVPVWLLHSRAWLAEHSTAGNAGVLEKAIYSGAMLAAVLTLYANSQPFIYFQF